MPFIDETNPDVIVKSISVEKVNGKKVDEAEDKNEAPKNGCCAKQCRSPSSSRSSSGQNSPKLMELIGQSLFGKCGGSKEEVEESSNSIEVTVQIDDLPPPLPTSESNSQSSSRPPSYCPASPARRSLNSVSGRSSANTNPSPVPVVADDMQQFETEPSNRYQVLTHRFEPADNNNAVPRKRSHDDTI